MPRYAPNKMPAAVKRRYFELIRTPRDLVGAGTGRFLSAKTEGDAATVDHVVHYECGNDLAPQGMIVELVAVAFDQLVREVSSQDPLEPGGLGEVTLEQLCCIGDLRVCQQYR
jgi:hypothetical protein